jgi:zinc protease
MHTIPFGARTGLAAAALAAGTVASPALAAAKPDTPSVTAHLPAVETWTLDNGLQVAYLGVSQAPVVTVQVWYHVGSKDENPARTGSAHMFEHMLFKGTTHVPPEEHARHLDRLGGSVNAGTTQDLTFYFNSVPSEYASFVCQLEAERMRNLLIREPMVASEREVVKEELRVREENNPGGKALKAFFDVAYQKHPYKWMPIGTKEHLDAIKVADLQQFYDTYYQPNNALLVIVGDIDRAGAEACAKDWFGPIPRGPEPPRPAAAAVEPEQTGVRRAEVEPAQVGFVAGGYKIPGAAHPDTVTLEVLAAILAGGDSSRLHKRMVVDEGISVGAGGELFRLEHPGLFFAYAAYVQPAAGPKVEAVLREEIAKVRDAGVSERELQKAKNQLVAGFVFGLESAVGLAMQIGYSWVNSGDPSFFLKNVAAYQAVTAADVQRVAAKYLTDDRLTLIVMPPKGGAM